MLGYYKRPDVTATVFDADGYYKTGDIMAEIGPDQLVYVDRRNNVLKLAQGEFVAIARLEALYTNGHPLIRQAYLYGTSERSYLVGVFVPNEAALQELAIARDDKAIKAALREAIKEVARNEQLNAYEVPRDFIVEREPFSVENGLLAGIGKYQRPKFKERYAARLEKLYDEIAASQANELQSLRREGRNAPVLETVARAVQATLGIEDIDLSTELQLRRARRRLALGALVLPAARGNLRRSKCRPASSTIRPAACSSWRATSSGRAMAHSSVRPSRPCMAAARPRSAPAI